MARPKKNTDPTAKAPRAIASTQSLSAFVKSICDVMRRSNCASALQYVPELTWILFLRILDAQEAREAEQAEVQGTDFSPALAAPWRWQDWAAPWSDRPDHPQTTDGRPQGWKRQMLYAAGDGRLFDFINLELLPHLHALDIDRRTGAPNPAASPKQRIIGRIMTAVERVRVDDEANLRDILDRVHEISIDHIDDTHFFTLSQVYEDLLLKMGEKNSDGGQFFTPREVIRAVVHTVQPRLGQMVYDPCCGTGGFLAVAWTDVFQGLLMAAALIIVPLVALDQLGGPTAALTQLQALNPALLDPFTAGNGQPLGFIAILSLAAWGLGYFGQPHILARFQAIRSPEAVPQARRIAVGWSLLTMAGAILTGLVGVLLLDSPLLGDEREKVFIQLVNLLFHPLVAGILLAAILAAIMSTADSQLLVTSATFTEDFYRRLLAREATPGHQVIAGRLAVVAVACLAFLLALDPRAHVLDLVAHAWAGFGATFGPVLLVAVYWSGMTWRGALAGMLTGGLVVIAWPPLLGDLFALYEIVPGFLLSLIAIWLVSRFGGGPRGELEAEFNRIARQLSPTDVVVPSR